MNLTTNAFLSLYGFNSLLDLPDMEKLEEAGLLSKDALSPRILRAAGASGLPSSILHKSGLAGLNALIFAR